MITDKIQDFFWKNSDTQIGIQIKYHKFENKVEKFYDTTEDFV